MSRRPASPPRARTAARTAHALALLLLLALTSDARAQPADPNALEPLAIWTFDPSRFASAGDQTPARLAATALLRAAVAGGLVEDDAPALLLELALVGATLGDAPHTLSLLDLRVSRRDIFSDLRIERIEAVLEVRTAEGHADLLRTVKSIAVDRYTPNGMGAQRAIDLPGARRGVSFRADSWPEWLSVSWVSLPDRFVLGVGESALQTWVSSLDEGGARIDAPEAHAAQVDAARARGDAFLAGGIDLDALRRRAPDLLAEGRLRRFAEICRLANARSFYLHGRWIQTGERNVPSLLTLDATYESRVDPPGVVRRRAVSLDRWSDAGLRNPPPGGSYALLLPVHWPGVVEFGMNARLALTPDSERPGRREAIRNWYRDKGRGLLGALSGLHPVLVVTDDPTPPVPAPGLATWLAETRRGGSANSVAASLARAVGSAAETTRSADGIYSLRLDPAGAIRVPAWGAAQHASAEGADLVVLGWGPVCVRAHRERLSEAGGGGEGRAP
jgi:hypothetical protein